MADWTLGLPVELNDKFFLIRVEILDRDDEQPVISLFDFGGRKSDCEGLLAVGVDSAIVR